MGGSEESGGVEKGGGERRVAAGGASGMVPARSQRVERLGPNDVRTFSASRSLFRDTSYRVNAPLSGNFKPASELRFLMKVRSMSNANV